MNAINCKRQLSFLGVCAVLAMAICSVSASANESYSHTVRVDTGTFDLEGESWTNLLIVGVGGRLENGSLVGCTVSNTNLTYGSTLSVKGRHVIDMSGRGRAGETFAAGRCDSGSAPDFSNWHVDNTAESGLYGKFSASGELISVTLSRIGIIPVIE